MCTLDHSPLFWLWLVFLITNILSLICLFLFKFGLALVGGVNFSLLLSDKVQASRNKLMNKKLSYISCMYYLNYVNILISHMHAIELKMTIIVCLVNSFFICVSCFSSSYGPTILIELCSMCLYDNLFKILLKKWNSLEWILWIKSTQKNF